MPVIGYDTNASLPARAYASTAGTAGTAAATISTDNPNVALLVWVRVATTNAFAFTSGNLTLSGGGLTWNLIRHDAPGAGAASQWYWAKASSPLVSQAITASFPATAGSYTKCSIIVVGLLNASAIGISGYASGGALGLTTQYPNSVLFHGIYSGNGVPTISSSTPAGETYYVAGVDVGNYAYGMAKNSVPTAGYTALTVTGGATMMVTGVEVTASPVISQVNPSSGGPNGGDDVTLTGTGFTGSTGVLFGANAATNVVVASDTTITCTTPAGAAGAVTVTVQNPSGDGALANGFTYYPGITTGFAAHMGASYNGTGSMPFSTFNTILDDLVSDLLASTAAGKANGWTLYDDQRNLQNGPTTMVVGYIYSGGIANGVTGGTTLTSASANVTGTYTLFNREFAQTSYTIQLANNGGAAWSTGYVSAVSSATALTLSSTWTPATATSQKTAMARVTAASGGATYGYVVFRCQSQNGHPDFFVRVMRPPSFGDLVRIDVFETWDNVAHSGTNSGPQEIIRCYSTQQTQTTQVAYMVWFLPEVFGFYGGQTPVNNIPGDFFYAGNLLPYRGVSEDPYCLVQACSHQGLSGFGVFQRGTVTNANQPSTGATINRLVGGYQSLWSSTAQNYANSVVFAPRGFDYMAQASAAAVDDRGIMQMLGIDAYHGVENNGMSDWLGIRGAVRYLRSPVMNPSNQFLNTFPADDGNTYIMVRVGYPTGSAGSSAPGYDIWPANALTGFGATACTLSAGQWFGELGFYASAVQNMIRRFFLLPVNL